MLPPPEQLEILAQLAREAEFEIFDSLPAALREHLRQGGRVAGYDEAVEAAFQRRLYSLFNQEPARKGN